MNRSRIGLSLLCVTAWLLVASVASAVTTIRGYNPVKHDRFYVGSDKAFIGNPYNWSGVSTYGYARWATMISPSYFITANHTSVGAGSVFRFYYTNNPSDGYETATVGTSAVSIGGSDLAIGKMSAQVSSKVAYYPILSLPSESGYLGKILYNIGLSDDASTPNINQRMGRNVIDSIGWDNSSRVFTYDYDTDSSGLGADESMSQGGDSGSPGFVICNGAPALVGCVYGGSNVLSTNPLVAYYASQINAYMSGSGEQLTLVVPEPSSLALLIAMILTGLAWYGRKTMRTK